MTPVVDLSHVTKVYRGRVRALDGMSMRVEPGDVFGLLGPNGAGKSTLVKILMGVIRATRCEGKILGERVGSLGVRARIGYLPEHHRFPEYLTGAQVIDFYGCLNGTPRARRRTRTAELLELVGMREWAGHRIRSYSKGMRQRIGIAQALVSDPEFVVLDEPTDGVDPVGRRDIRLMFQRLKGEGRTVLINSHLLGELEMVCDRVAILVKGRVVSQGTLDELTRHHRRYELEFLPPAGAGPEAGDEHERVLPIVRSTLAIDLAPGVGRPDQGDVMVGRLATGESVEVTRTMVRIETIDPRVVQPILDAARARGLVIRAVREARPSLEDLFMSAVTDPTTGRALAPGADTGKRRAEGRA